MTCATHAPSNLVGLALSVVCFARTVCWPSCGGPSLSLRESMAIGCFITRDLFIPQIVSPMFVFLKRHRLGLTALNYLAVSH